MKDSSHGHDLAGPNPENSVSPRKKKEPKHISMARFLIEKRGYIVVGFKSTEHRVGEIIRDIWTYPVEQPFQLIARTNAEDWEEQGRVAKTLNRYADPESPSNIKNYFRAATD